MNFINRLSKESIRFIAKTSDIKKKYNLSKGDLHPFMPINEEEILEANLEILAITDFINYNPQNNY